MKKTLIIFIILTLVFLGLLSIRHMKREALEQQEAKEVAIAKMSFDFDPMKITECVVATQQERVELKKENGIWKITNRFGGINADAMAFIDFMASLKKINTDERIVDETHLKLFGLMPDEAINVQLYQEGQKKEDLLLGIKRTQQNINFIRRYDSNKVYAVNEDVLTYLGFGKEEKDPKLNLDRWVDKRVVMFDDNSVNAFQIYEQGVLKTSLKKETKEDKKSFWIFISPYSYAIDQEKVKNYLKMLTQLRGSGVLEVESLDFNDQDWYLEMLMKDGSTIKLSRKITEQGECYLRVGERGYATKVSVYLIENLLKTDGNFFVDNPLNIVESNVSEIKVQDFLNKKKHVFGVKNQEKRQQTLSLLKNIRIETFVHKMPKGNEVLSIVWSEGNMKRSLKIWNRPDHEDLPTCFIMQVDKNKDSLCIEESSLKSFVGLLTQ